MSPLEARLYCELLSRPHAWRASGGCRQFRNKMHLDFEPHQFNTVGDRAQANFSKKRDAIVRRADRNGAKAVGPKGPRPNRHKRPSSRAVRIPCSRKYFCCYCFQNSPLLLIGNTAEMPQFAACSTANPGFGQPASANFPVFFPVSREFGAETGLHGTGSSARRCGLEGILPACRKTCVYSAACGGMVSLFSGNLGPLRRRGPLLTESLWSQIFNIQFLHAETWFDSTETG